ncbi:NAD(P)H-dependent glycerol-3-phosphate dehydrogenase [Halopseudomonas yangmingensis]|uniref:Glycerol-3-phosphate dehydrogenase [NAD(P)+] n=1 Tax=Halopseudomonas yangmingensis TaxID=1720063 RepID=A0A1I4QBY2_9GAMM|nr:NAD(P)H-dependent glycerol-3-phosphate dehydrogenase [Halopseudomonas yangmingensis]SFM37611.1 glycerol-3-phosphate dehydrogenase (NAD(P)+) [Halopseudomonas yangmingensis]
MSDKPTVAVLGGGSFGTTLGGLMAANGIDVTLWMRDAGLAATIRETRQNSRYLPDIQLDPRLQVETDLQQVLASASLVFLAIPSGAFRSVLREAAPLLAGKGIVSTTKGIEQPGFLMMSEIVAEEVPTARVAVLSGPNLAREMAAGALTATVVASADDQLCREVQQVLGSRTLRVYASQDHYGVELGGALKNVYAIISGMAAAMGMGENTRSMLITRALAEMTRFAVHMGANPLTFLGLAGVGDLIVTCMSPLSRNYQVGHALGQGLSLEESVARLGQVAEGVNTLKVLRQKAEEEGVYMPLVNGLHAILFEQLPLDRVVGALMGGEQKHDVEFAALWFAGEWNRGEDK